MATTVLSKVIFKKMKQVLFFPAHIDSEMDFTLIMIC